MQSVPLTPVELASYVAVLIAQGALALAVALGWSPWLMFRWTRYVYRWLLRPSTLGGLGWAGSLIAIVWAAWWAWPR